MSSAVQQMEKLVHEGRFLEARSRTELLLKETGDSRLMQLLALSMAKSGAAKAAMDLLEPVYRQHPEDPETSGILGGIYKELFKETRNSRYAILSRDTYLSNFRLTGNYYTGINAASMSAIAGSMSKAKEIARELIARLDPLSADVWELASLAEAFMLIREKERAVELYLQCRHLLGFDWGKVSSVFNQLWLLNHYIPVSAEVMDTFSPPAVAAFVGHMIDHSARKLSRFPSQIEGEIRHAIAGAIQSINAKIGYCSLACGSDILFAEAMADSGGEVNLFLPFDKRDFVETSVSFAGEDWLKRFEMLTERFPVNYVSADRYMGNDDLFSFQSRVIFGSAVHRAAMLHSSPHLVTVYADVDILGHIGGTYDTLKFWPDKEKRININPQHYVKTSFPESQVADVPAARAFNGPASKKRHVRYLVCVSLENANAEQRNRLQYQLNKRIGDNRLREIERRHESQLVAFKTIEEAAGMAWAIFKITGFPSIGKISLHAGPVYSEVGGAAISGRAADIAWAINSFSVPGRAYSSFQFASVLALQQDQYAVEYAGIISVSGKEMSVFQVNRHADAFDLV